MHVQILNFQLKDVSEEDYTKLAGELAPAFSAVAGMDPGYLRVVDPEFERHVRHAAAGAAAQDPVAAVAGISLELPGCLDANIADAASGRPDFTGHCPDGVVSLSGPHVDSAVQVLDAD